MLVDPPLLFAYITCNLIQLHDADPAVGAPELIDHSSGNNDGVVNDAVVRHGVSSRW